MTEQIELKFKIKIKHRNSNIVDIVDIKKFPLVIGRDVDCDILLDDQTVSLKHASINLDKMNNITRLRIKNLESRNGVYVDNRPIQELYITQNTKFLIGVYELEIIFLEQKLDATIKMLNPLGKIFHTAEIIGDALSGPKKDHLLPKTGHWFWLKPFHIEGWKRLNLFYYVVIIIFFNTWECFLQNKIDKEGLKELFLTIPKDTGVLLTCSFLIWGIVKIINPRNNYPTILDWLFRFFCFYFILDNLLPILNFNIELYSIKLGLNFCSYFLLFGYFTYGVIKLSRPLYSNIRIWSIYFSFVAFLVGILYLKQELKISPDKSLHFGLTYYYPLRDIVSQKSYSIDLVRQDLDQAVDEIEKDRNEEVDKLKKYRPNNKRIYQVN